MSADLPADNFLGSRRTMSIAPVLIGCAIAAVAMVSQTPIGAWLRGFFASRVPSRELRRQINYIPSEILRQRVLGRSKAAVVALLGPPRTALLTSRNTAFANPSAFFPADTWYYVLDSASQTALAVRFAEGFATTVEVFGMREI